MYYLVLTATASDQGCPDGLFLFLGLVGWYISLMR